MAPKLYTAIEAREILRIGRTRMSALMVSGEIPSFKVGPHRRITEDALRSYVERLQGTQAA